MTGARCGFPTIAGADSPSRSWRHHAPGVLSALALALLLNGLLYRLLFPSQPDVAGLAFFLAAMFSLLAIAAQTFFPAAAHACLPYTDQLVLVAVLACFANGDYILATLLPVVMNAGHFLEERSIAGVSEAIRGLSRYTVLRARRLGETGEESVSADELHVGDRVRVLPGEIIPADGRVVKGRSAVDQSSITGEAEPDEVRPGADVFAGAINCSGPLEVEVCRTGENTALGRARALLIEAQHTRPTSLALVEQYAQWYVPAVVGLAFLVFLMTHEVSRYVSILIAACPCAFVLASPTAVVAALAVATRFGVLIKSSRVLETVGVIRTLILDKTGTLTFGRLSCERIECCAGWTEGQVLRCAIPLAAASRHPASRAIVEAATNRGLLHDKQAQDGKEAPAEFDTQEISGKGLRGRVGEKTVLLGRRSWLAENGVELTGTEATDGTEVCMAVDGQHVATFYVRDTIRPEAKKALDILKQLGVERIVLLTGDREPTAVRVAKTLGCDGWKAGLLPEEKVEFIRAEKRSGAVLGVVGDGINDAPALATGDVGIAMGAIGNDIAIQAADVALMRDDLTRIPTLVELSCATRRTIQTNLIAGALFSLAFLFSATAGLASPLTVAIAHNAGALFVLINSSRLLRFRGEVSDRS